MTKECQAVGYMFWRSHLLKARGLWFHHSLSAHIQISALTLYVCVLETPGPAVLYGSTNIKSFGPIRSLEGVLPRIQSACPPDSFSQYNNLAVCMYNHPLVHSTYNLSAPVPSSLLSLCHKKQSIMIASKLFIGTTATLIASSTAFITTIAIRPLPSQHLHRPRGCRALAWHTWWLGPDFRSPTDVAKGCLLFKRHICGWYAYVPKVAHMYVPCPSYRGSFVLSSAASAAVAKTGYAILLAFLPHYYSTHTEFFNT